jgi:hypothetical protein
MKKKLIATLCVLVFIFVGKNLYTTLFAQQANKGITVTPSNIEVYADRGTIATKEITVINDTSADVNIVTRFRNFTAMGEEGQVELTSENSSFSLASWLKISPEKQTLKKEGKAKFVLAINVPKDAEPGGHFGSVIFSTVPKAGLKQTGALVSQEIASLILTRINGQVNEDAKLESFNTSKSFYWSGPAEFNIRVKNNSTVHIKPEGKITIRNILGQSFEIPVESKNILPNAIRRLTAGFNSPLLIGRYTATLSLAYGTQNNPLLAAQTTFYAFPAKTALITLVVLILGYLFRKRLFKALKILIIGR